MVKKGHPRKLKSKRMTFKQKYKIQKKVKEHKRKMKRDAKRNPGMNKRKDPGIPNLAPFKEAILKDAAERRMKILEQKEKKKAERKKMTPLEKMRVDAEGRQKGFQSKVADKQVKDIQSKDLNSSRRAYFREVKKVVEAADVLIEVLDARDPLGTRCLELEKEILTSGTQKKLVLLLNKIDLVPRSVVEQWLKYLRNELPTIAFKACTQVQGKKLSQYKYTIEATPDHMLYSSQCLGATALLKLLGNYCRSADIKTSISVGVVGFPNVGKSSVINSLKRKKACSVGDFPGLTKCMQEIILAKNIKLLDCPGLVLSKANSEVTMVLRNCVKLDTISDPVAPIEAILERCNREQLMLHYTLPKFKGADEFLKLMAKKKGRFKKGGIPNIKQAAKAVLQDWSSGKIPFYTSPPAEHTLPTHISAEIVSQFTKFFQLNTASHDQKILKEVSESGPTVLGVEMTSGDRIQGVQSEDDFKEIMKKTQEDEKVLVQGDEEEMAEEDEEDEQEGESEGSIIEDDEDMEQENEDLDLLTVDLPTESSPADEAKARGRILKQLMEAKANMKATRVPAGNKQLGKEKKLAYKKVLKKRRKADKLSTKLSEDLTKAMSSLGNSGDDIYNVNDIFQ